MFKYYFWRFRCWFCETFRETFVDRIVFSISGEYIREPDLLFPLKYNEKTNEFDKFYSWKEIVTLHHSLLNPEAQMAQELQRRKNNGN